MTSTSQSPDNSNIGMTGTGDTLLSENSNTTCYWCGKKVELGGGSREHIVPRTILQDATVDISDLIIGKTNAHTKCNKEIGDKHEHDFCQIIFHYSIDDTAARKHIMSKIDNLKRRPLYLRHQLSRMQKVNGRTEIGYSESEAISFEIVIQKILKGLYFKLFSTYLNLESEFRIEILWSTLNIEQLDTERNKVISILKIINNEVFSGNTVFKYRYKQAENAKSSIWELVFYDRFPIYCFLIHKDNEYAFKH